MREIQLVDCTLGDGGYINEWQFGKYTVENIIAKLNTANVDILELGVLKNEQYKEGRTVFDSIERANDLVINKQNNINFALTIEASELESFDKIECVAPNGVSIIRVVVDVTTDIMTDKNGEKIKRIIEHCSTIIQSGYKLHLMLANLEKCSENKFIQVVREFLQLSLNALYIVDSWGTKSSDDVLHYMHLMEEIVDFEVDFGYHGHDNLMQALDVAKNIVKEGFSHNILLDAGVHGIGCRAGNLSLENVAQFLNDCYDKNYGISDLLEIYSNEIKEIYMKKAWGYAITYYMAAKYNCAPEYADYFTERNASEDEIRFIIDALSDDERSVFNKSRVEQILYEVRKANRSLAIVVPTCNRVEEISYWINSIGGQLYELGYDLIFYDSSSEENINLINYQIEKSKLPNVKRMHYSGIVNGVLCNKVYDAAKEIAPHYDYIWIVRDRSVPIIPIVMSHFEKAYRENADFVVIYPHYLEPRFYGKDIYTDCAKLLKDFCGEMTSLGAIMFSKKTMLQLVENYPVDEQTNYGLWLPIALFQYIGNNSFKCYYFGNNAFVHLPYSGSFWIKQKTLSWLFVKRWNEMIDLLPNSYDDVREDVRQFKGWALSPFSIDLVKQGRASGDLNLFCILKNWKNLQRCAGKMLPQLLLFSLVPSGLFRYYEAHKSNVISRLIYWVLNRIVRPVYSIVRALGQTIYSFVHIKKKHKLFSGLDYEKYENVFEFDNEIKSHLLEGNNRETTYPYLSIVIPTNERYDTLKDALESILNQNPVTYEWEVVVVDNQPYDGTENDTQRYIRGLHNKHISYYRNEKNLGAGGNMNRGALLARGKWIAFLHDDDVLCSDYLERINKIISTLEKQNKNVGLVLGDMFIVNCNDFNKDNYHYWDYYITSDKKKYQIEQITRQESIYTGDLGFKAPTCGCTYLREAYIRNGGINERTIGIEADFALDYTLTKKYEAYRCLSPFGIYRWGKNESAGKVKEILSALYDLQEYIYRQSILGRILSGMLRQEYTIRNCQIMGKFDNSGTNTLTYGLIQYYPNPLRKFFIRLMNARYKRWQKKNRINCSD